MKGAEKMDYGEKAKKLFESGYNCSQAVFCAFCDKTGIDMKTSAKLASSFGGGMGRLREVCGAVSGMFMVIGVLYGYDEPKNGGIKAEHYERIQKLAKEFESEAGSIICRELLGLEEKRSEPIPEKRTEQYYKKRPCAELVYIAAKITEKFIL